MNDRTIQDTDAARKFAKAQQFAKGRAGADVLCAGPKDAFVQGWFPKVAGKYVDCGAAFLTPKFGFQSKAQALECARHYKKLCQDYLLAATTPAPDRTIPDATQAGKHTQKAYNSGPMAVRQSYMDDEEFEVYPTHGGEVPDHGEWTELATVYSLTKDLADANANASRLAAAWNACEGIPTEALDAGVVADMLPIARIVALLPISDVTPDNIPVTGVNGVYITHGDVRAARAAAARATGDAQ